VPGELLGDPLRQGALRDVVDQDLPCLRARLGERRVLADLVRDEREHGARRRRRQVVRDRLRVRDLPTLDTVDEHEPALSSEQSHRVAGGDRVVAGRFLG
jgi:hypothetical protein